MYVVSGRVGVSVIVIKGTAYPSVLPDPLIGTESPAAR